MTLQMRRQRGDDGKFHDYYLVDGQWVAREDIATESPEQRRMREELDWLQAVFPDKWRAEVAKDRQAAFVAEVREHPERYQQLLDEHHLAVAERERRSGISGPARRATGR